jgi:hypothetical protein
MRCFLLILVLAALTGCASPSSWQFPQMPETFLGYWKPLSRTAGWTSIHIYPDGHIQHADMDSKKTVQTSYYKVVRVISPNEIYIAQFEPEKEKSFPGSDSYDYAKLNIEWDHDLGRNALMWESASILDERQWQSFTPAQFWKFYRQYIEDGSQISGTASYIRPN